MPRSLQARRMRSAISARLAMTTLSSMKRFLAERRRGRSDEGKQRLVELHRLGIVDETCFADPTLVGLHLVHRLRGLDDADHVAVLDELAEFHKGWRAGRGGAVTTATDGGFDGMCTGGRRGGHGGWGRSSGRSGH